MPKDKYKKARASKLLHQIGWWATLWWAVTCSYALLVVWQSRDYFINNPGNPSLLENLAQSIKSASQTSSFLQILLLVIIVGWIVCGTIWLKALKQQKVSYKVALKDLFLTIRR